MKISNYFWTTDQKTKLTTAYREGGGLKAAMLSLPEKNRGQIATQASRLKLSIPKPRRNK